MEANNVVLWAKEDAVCFVLRCIDGDGPEFDEGRPVPQCDEVGWFRLDEFAAGVQFWSRHVPARFIGLKKRAYLDSETQTTLAEDAKKESHV